jgi:hypothetical protein
MHVTPSTSARPHSLAQAEVAMLVNEAVPRLLSRISPIQRYDSEADRFVAALRHSTVNQLAAALLGTGFKTAARAIEYRRAGHSCRCAGLSFEEVTTVTDSAAEAVRDDLIVPAARAIEGQYGVPAADRAVIALCKVVDDFARSAYRQLELAYREAAVSR